MWIVTFSELLSHCQSHAKLFYLNYSTTCCCWYVFNCSIKLFIKLFSVQPTVFLAREGKFSQKFKYYSKIFCAWFANIIMTERKRSHFSCNSFRFRAVQKLKKWGKCRHKFLIIITPLLDRLQKRESYRANKRFYPVLTNLEVRVI